MCLVVGLYLQIAGNETVSQQMEEIHSSQVQRVEEKQEYARTAAAPHDDPSAHTDSSITIDTRVLA